MKKRISIFLVGILLFSFSFSGCSNEIIQPKNNVAAALSNEMFKTKINENIQQVIDVDNNNIKGLNNIGYSVTQDIYSDSSENILFSPLSLSCALSMLVNGAEGDTKNQIIEAMGVNDETLNTTYNQLINLLNSYSKEKDLGSEEKVKTTEIITANSAWFNKNVNVEKDFVDTLKKYYDADTMNVDFSDENTKDLINEWIEEKTNNIIKDTIEETYPIDIAYLINTLYFKGTWRDDFNEELTKKTPFYLADGSEVEADMMFGIFRKKYYEDDTCQILGLDYYDVTMYVILPKGDLKTFVSSEEYSKIEDMIKEAEYNSNINIYLPKFKYKNSIDLKEIIKNIGVTKIFNNENAELKKIADLSPENVFVSSIFQNTSIEVDEKGTEAAAVTVVLCRGTSVEAPAEKIEFNCNKPFMYVIKENKTETNLFMGIVQNPTNQN